MRFAPSFNTFYEYMRDDYRRELAEREIKVEKPVLRQIVAGYIELSRNTPLLIQLFFIYYRAMLFRRMAVF